MCAANCEDAPNGGYIFLFFLLSFGAWSQSSHLCLALVPCCRVLACPLIWLVAPSVVCCRLANYSHASRSGVCDSDWRFFHACRLHGVHALHGPGGVRPAQDRSVSPRCPFALLELLRLVTIFSKVLHLVDADFVPELKHPIVCSHTPFSGFDSTCVQCLFVSVCRFFVQTVTLMLTPVPTSLGWTNILNIVRPRPAFSLHLSTCVILLPWPASDLTVVLFLCDAHAFRCSLAPPLASLGVESDRLLFLVRVRFVPQAPQDSTGATCTMDLTPYDKLGEPLF